MNSSRLLASAAIGFFSLLLGGLALSQRSAGRASRFFALHNFCVAALFILPGPVIGIANHGLALFLYRAVQIALPAHCFFLICFIQELAGNFGTTASRRIRYTTLILLFAAVPLYLSPLMIKDFSNTLVGTDQIFNRVPGALYMVGFSVFFVLFLTAAVLTLQSLRQSAGIRRNQLLFVSMGVGAGLVSLICVLAGSVTRVSPALTFGAHAVMELCFAYAIFKYDLFDFDLWVKRLSIGAAVYIGILSLPLFVYYPFRDKLMALGDSMWNVLAGLTMAFGLLFSLMPALVAYLRDKSEQKRWAHMRHSLEFVKAASEELADENGRTLDDIANRLVETLRQFYWDRMKSPLQFAAAAAANDEAIAVGIFPKFDIDKRVLGQFIQSLRNLPVDVVRDPFSPFELEQRLAHTDDETIREALSTVKNYLRSNDVEICCPCVHDGKINGALLLGPKEKGIFWPEELSTLRLAASHGATAVRKSQLLSVNQDLKDLDRMKAEFISNITHEFKTPINIVETAVETLLDDAVGGKVDSAKMRDYLMMIKNNTAQLGLFIQNLLALARIEQARVDLQTEDVNLNTLAAKSVELLKPLAAKKGITLTLESSEPIWTTIDTEKMGQVIGNLLSNAIKFTQKGGVRVIVAEKADKAEVRVVDTGAGIPPEHLSAVFEKFFQAPNGQSVNANGTGLGLAIAKGWVEAHGGRIWAESAGIGNGAAFIVQLPLAMEPQ